MIVLLFYVHGKHQRSCRDGQSTLFLGRLRPPKPLTSTSCTYFRHVLTTALLGKAEGETKVRCQTGGNNHFEKTNTFISVKGMYLLVLNLSMTRLETIRSNPY